MASRGCAQGPDGELLDASEITWYNDADSDEPISSSKHPAANSGSSLHPRHSVTTIDHFFPPLQEISGSRRSARIPRPSTKSTDPDNAMVPVAAPLKRKGSAGIAANAPSRRARKIVVDSDDDCTTEPNISDVEDHSEPHDDVDGSGQNSCAEDTDEATVAYQHTKSLGDADREVGDSFPCRKRQD
jgi:hypothetical protein